jgi:hypothetical protein
MGRHLDLVRLHPKHPYSPSPTAALRRRYPARAAARAHRPMLNCEGRENGSVPDRGAGGSTSQPSRRRFSREGEGCSEACELQPLRAQSADEVATVHSDPNFPFECWSSLSVWFRNSKCSRCQVRPPNAILGRLGALPRAEYLNRSRHCLSAAQSARQPAAYPWADSRVAGLLMLRQPHEDGEAAWRRSVA